MLGLVQISHNMVECPFKIQHNKVSNPLCNYKQDHSRDLLVDWFENKLGSVSVLYLFSTTHIYKIVQYIIVMTPSVEVYKKICLFSWHIISKKMRGFLKGSLIQRPQIK